MASRTAAPNAADQNPAPEADLTRLFLSLVYER